MENNMDFKADDEILVEKYIVNIVDYESYEKWLEDKETEGWNLSSLKYSRASIEAKNSAEGEHEFVKGRRRQIRYCLDYKFIVEKEYEKIFQDFGWTLVAKGKDFFLWAMEYEGERPEAFDRISVMEERGQKYITSLIRYMVFYGVFLFFFLIAFGIKYPFYIYLGYSILFLGARVLYRWSDIKYIGVYLRNKKIIDRYKV